MKNWSHFKCLCLTNTVIPNWGVLEISDVFHNNTGKLASLYMSGWTLWLYSKFTVLIKFMGTL
jgi:hypothetical protein